MWVFFRYSLWLFISDLEAPATTQCPSDATQERAPLPYCFNRKTSWGGELKDSFEEQNSPDKSDPKSGCIQKLPPESVPSEPAGHNWFHDVRKNDWRPWHFVHHLRQVVVFLWAPVSSSPTHTAFLWFDKFWQISNQQSINGEKRGESLTGGCGSGKYFLS